MVPLLGPRRAEFSVCLREPNGQSSGIRISNAVGYGETHIHDTDELYRWCMKRFARSGGKSADVSQSSITAQCHGDMLLPGHDPASETWAPVDGSKRNPNERP